MAECIYLNPENAKNMGVDTIPIIPDTGYYLRQLSRISAIQLMKSKIRSTPFKKLLSFSFQALINSPCLIIKPVSTSLYLTLYYEICQLRHKPKTIIIDEKIVDLFVLNEKPKIFKYLNRKFNKKNINIILLTKNKKFILSKYPMIFGDTKNFDVKGETILVLEKGK
jgi:hypothetical protein